MNVNTKLSEIRNSSFAKKVINGTLFLSTGTIISKVAMACGYIILIRILSPYEYGQYGMINSTISNFLIFASMGIGVTTTKYLSEYKNENPKVASGILGTSLLTVLFLGFFIALGIICFSNFIAFDYLKSPELKSSLIYASLILLLSAVNSIQLGALLGLESFKTNAKACIFQGVFVAFGTVIGGTFYGVQGAVIGNLIGVALLTFIIHYFLKKECLKFSIIVNIRTWRKDLNTIYKFALPASLSSLIVSPAIWVLNSMLVRTPDGYSQLGLYNAVLVFTTAVQLLNGSLNNVLLPIFLSKETSTTVKIDFFNYYGTWLITMVLALPFMVYPEMVYYFLGSKYPKEEVIKIVGISLISTLIIANKEGIVRDLIRKSKMWLSVFSMGQWSACSIILFYFLDDYGALGFASSITISYFINLLVFTPFFVKMNICPAFIFFNKWILFIWMILLSIIFFNTIQYFEIYERVIFSSGLILILFYFIYKLYINNISKNYS